MKNYIKFLILMAFFLFLVSVNTLTASAEDDIDEEETKNRYKTEITVQYVDFGKLTGGTAVYTIYSDKPFYIFYHHTDEPAAYPRYFCGNLEDFDYNNAYGYVSTILNNVSVSGTLTLPDGSNQMTSLVNSALVYQGQIRMTMTATCPIFYSAEGLKNYLETGDE
ncbi:MAG: hypothetical protein K2G16_02665, partial [Lachnospiraceae bacterium]|nr:hypothetical protein [Lachnospiraceae bacterium]